MNLRHAVRGPLSAAIIAAAAFAGLAAPAARAQTLNQSWNGWKWARSGNLQVKVGDNVSSVWDPFLRTAASQWSADPVIDFAVVAGTSSPGTCNPVWGTVQACSAAYGFNGWLGWAQVWTSGGFIVQATVKLNDSYFASSKYNTAAWRAMTVCHELGHTLGLSHADNTRTNANIGSCLDLTNDPTGLTAGIGPLANIQPGANDFRWLSTIYATPSGTQLPSTRVTLSSGLEVPEPGIWAMLVAGFGLTGMGMRRRALRRVVA